MVLEIELQHAESLHTFVLASHSRLYAAIPERTLNGPVLQVHIIQLLGTHGIEIQIPSTTTPDRNSWIVTCRGKNRFMDESTSQRSRNQSHEK